VCRRIQACPRGCPGRCARWCLVESCWLPQYTHAATGRITPASSRRPSAAADTDVSPHGKRLNLSGIGGSVSQ
jgi:hypothetical protein